MHRELPLYIFIRNSILLCTAFFSISAFIIEKGRFERGENSIFNKILLKENNLRDYNNYDITKSQKNTPLIDNTVILVNSDSIFQPIYKPNFTSILVQNKEQNNNTNRKVDL